MKYDAVLFDLDGTVLDTVDDIASALNRALKSHGFAPVGREQTRAALGNGTRRLVEQALPEDCPEKTKEAVIAQYRDIYEANCHKLTRPYAGMVELLRELKEAKVKTAIVSNKPDSMVQILERVYYPGVPDLVVGEQAGLARKPAPDMIAAARKALGVEAKRCVYVGDSEVDIQTARGAGLECISVSWGFRSREQLVEAGAAPIADNITALRSYLGL